MQEVIIFIIGIIVLGAGIPIGLYLARITSEELKVGQKWFKLIMIISGIGTIVSLIIRDDIFLFGFLFILIVTAGSVKNAQGKKKKAETMNRKELENLILKRYEKVCGDFGRKIFEKKVLPKAFDVFKDSSELVIKLYTVIQIARDYKLNKIDEYLLDFTKNLDK